MTGKSAQPRAARAQLTAQLATNLRRARLRRGLSVEALARLARVGRSTISQIERGGCAPTINVLARLSRALRVEVGRLVAGHGGGTIVLRHDQLAEPITSDGGLAIRALFPAGHAIGARFYQVRLGATGKAGLDSLRDDTSASAVTVLVAEGRARLELPDETHDLLAGDAVAFRLGQPHALVNRGHGDATLYVVVAPPIATETRTRA
ncbi:MAG: XRE family transcriptional regulator [Deltaproteobacteria bacterium]|nr:XRE family transcriptional regulator [Deltaproteobacteria bacterium]